MLGIVSASQVIGYSIMAQNTNPDYAGISIGFGNSLIMLFTSSSQMIFGILLHKEFMTNSSFLGNYTVPISFMIFLFLFSFCLSSIKKEAN